MTRRELLAGALAMALIRQEPKAFEGEAVFERLRDKALGWRNLPIGSLTGLIALELRGTPYVGHTIELDDVREIVCANFLGLDCVTLYENSLCLARMIRKGGRRPQDLLREIGITRYRGGHPMDFLSRLHYTSDWIFDNARRAIVRDMTPDLPGAVQMDKRIDFMSTHPEAYRQLKANPAWVKTMAKLEEEITARRPWYVPSEKVAAIEPLLQTGDIVGIATRAEGLDCSHTGLCFVDEAGALRFLHASSVAKQVVLGERLSAYALGSKRNLGVMIARPL